MPIYEAAVTRRAHAGARVIDMNAGDMLEALRMHVEDGVDFVTVHCGITRRSVERPASATRASAASSAAAGRSSPTGSPRSGQENPYYERFDEVLGMLREADVTLSLGDGLRPGAIADSFDAAQVEELVEMAGLAKRALAAGVQVMIEGPGHVPLERR